MLIFSEFVIIPPNLPFPVPESFMKTWNAAQFIDIDGDYYVEGIEDYWTTLEIKCKEVEYAGRFQLFTYRENHPYPFPLIEQEDLKIHIEHFRDKDYGNLKGIESDKPLATSYLSISTPNIEIYMDFLATVAGFLEVVKGYVVNYKFLDSGEFKNAVGLLQLFESNRGRFFSRGSSQRI